MRRFSFSAGVFWACVLGLASTAEACGGGRLPDRFSMLPGLTLLRPDMLVVLPILSGALERPFYSLCGYRTHTLAFSIQANFLGLLASSALGCFALATHGAMLSPLNLIPPAGALLVKFLWFDRLVREDVSHSRLLWFSTATIFSTLVIALVPFWMSVFGTDRTSYAFSVRDFQPLAIASTTLIALAVVAGLFSQYQRPPRGEDPRRGFEVLPGEPLPLASVATSQ